MSFTQGSLANLKDQLNIVDVIGRAVKLEKKGSSYKGVCPFHKEKTASFDVNEQRQRYRCFGCQAYGDVFEFVQQYYNLTFNEAAERLSKEYNIPLEKTGSWGENNDIYYAINREAAKFFYKAFTEKANKGYSYMKGREIKPEILKKFGIGYADEEWDSLYKHLKSLGFEEKHIVELGLAAERNGKYYDKFRNRVIFPIINTGGKVIGFGGRAIDKNDVPKYLNSPESQVFKKKNNLYGLNLSRNAVSKEGYIILVEGYMDVIGLYQGGIENVAASLGTALTDSQAKMIKRYTNKVVLSYDADGAGRAAALRGMDILKEEECDVSVMHVTDGKDPDEFIKKDGKTAFLDLVSKAKPFGDYKIETAVAGLNLSDYRERIQASKRIALVLLPMSPAEQEEYADKASREYNLSKMALLEEISSLRDKDKGRSRRSEALNRTNSTIEGNSEGKISLIEGDLIRLITKNESYIDKIINIPGLISSKLACKLFDAIANDVAREGMLDINRVLDSLEEGERDSLTTIMRRIVISGDEEEVFQDCLSRKRVEGLSREITEIDQQLQTIPEDADEEYISKLMQKKIELQEMINRERKEDSIDG